MLELWPKRLQLFHEMVPQAKGLGYLHSRANREAWEAQGRPGDFIARKMGVTWVGPPLEYPINEAACRRVFVGLTQFDADGFMVGDEYVNAANHTLIVELAEKKPSASDLPIQGLR